MDTLVKARKENPAKYTFQIIRDEVNGLVIAGDTVSTLVTFAIFLISQHPEVLRKVQDEVDRVYGNYLF